MIRVTVVLAVLILSLLVWRDRAYYRRRPITTGPTFVLAPPAQPHPNWHPYVYEWLTLEAGVVPDLPMDVIAATHCFPPDFRRCRALVRHR